ncbi:MAG: ETC complex I subunit [Methylobacteriaceae bacterium]|nr:ETC complex I subunit [Methylobacteriaceae bacterium]
MVARIFRPTRSAMQSGKANTKSWHLEFEPESPRGIEPLMGWTSSADMNSQVGLSFDTKEEAIAYARRNGLAYRVEEPMAATRKVISYADNFKFNRVGQWTH